MGFVRFWSRTALRRRWRAVVGIALLLGLVGGLSLFAVAGARRTQSAYPRFLSAKHPSTLVVDVGGLSNGGYEELDRIAHLPQVTQARAYAAFYGARWTDQGPALSENFEAIGSIDGRYFVQDVFTPTSGRRPDPARADEIAVNEESARRFGYHVGQEFDFGVASADDVESSESDADDQAIQPRLLEHVRIVGVGSFVEEVLQDDTDRSPLVLLTPAFVAKAKGLETYAWQGLVLKHGDADLAAVQAAVQTGPSGGAAMFRQTSIDEFHAEKATRPVSLALATFGLLAALAVFVLVGQAIGRYLSSEREVGATARALGARPAAVALASAANPALAIGGGIVLAGALAVAASPLMPVGRVGRFEVAPGIDADWTVLLAGGAVLGLGLLAVTLVWTWREAVHRGRAPGPSRRRLFATSTARLTDVSPALATGVRFAVDRGDQTRAVPVWSVMAGAVVAVAALVAAVTFGASMDHLVATPDLFGWNWNVALVDGAGYGNTNPVTTKDVLGGDHDVATWSGAFFGSDQVDGENLPLLGMEPGATTTPPVRAGRMVMRSGEIVLGTETIRHLGKHIGDTVSTTAGPATIVGTATFPSIGVVHGNHTSLGVGGIVVTEDVPGWARNVGEGDGSEPVPPTYGPNVLFVRYRSGVDPSDATNHLTGIAEKLGDYNGVVVTPPQRSAEIVNTREVNGSSTTLGAAVAVAALASLTVALTAVVVRRRRDLAVLKSLGFTRRQISAAIAWQATTTVLVGVVLGVPLGIALGRLLWSRFAASLQVLSAPVTPMGPILGIAVTSIIAANLIAVVPRRMARSVPSEVALRAE
jgi:hypothetical protein